MRWRRLGKSAGCFAFWLWLWLGRSAAWAIPGVLSLVAFAFLLSRIDVSLARRAYVGIAKQIWVMVAAIVVAMALMLVASGPLASLIERHASVKMLALSFLLLIGPHAPSSPPSVGDSRRIVPGSAKALARRGAASASGSPRWLKISARRAMPLAVMPT